MNTVLLVLLIVCAALLVATLVTFLVIYFAFFKPNVLRLTKPMKALDPSGYFADFLEDLEAGKEWFSEQHYINVHTRSEDGIKLHGYFLKAENARGTVMLVHGFHGDGVNDFASAYRTFMN